MKNRFRRMLAIIFALTITAASFGWQKPQIPAEAKTVAEIEQEKKEKQAAINAKKEQLAKLADDLSQKEKYKQTLNEEIELINGKMLLIDTQLQNLHQDMEKTEQEIDTLQEQIEEQTVEVNEDLQLFKKRLRVMYVHGNDSILSALVGSSSFYDVLAKVDIIKRISKHDDDLIKKLHEEIKALSKNQQDLTANLQALNIKETEMGVLYDEFKSSQQDLNAAFAANGTEIQKITNQQSDIQVQIDTDQQIMEELDEEEEKIIAEIIAKAEAERLAKEAAEKKAKEEAAKKQKEEQEKKQREEEARKAAMTTTAKPQPVVTTTAKPAAPAVTHAPQPAVTAAPKTEQKQTVTTAAPAQNPIVTTAPPATQAPAPVTTVAPTTAAPPPATTAAPAPAQADYRGGKLAWPAPGYYRISSGFGPRWGTHHSGIDIIGSSGPINGAAACAAASGSVICVRTGCTHNFGKNYNCGCNGGYGNFVILSHGNGLYTLYAHLARPTVSEGQQVTVGQQIGVIGSTGHSTGPHLHFEVRVGGNSTNNRVDPEAYLF